MRVIITSIGQAGDVFPFFAMAQALMRRGHDAVLLLPPRFRNLAATFGIQFIPLKPSAGARIKTSADNLLCNGLGMLRLWRDVLLPNVPVLVESLSAICSSEKPDWVIYHPASIGVPWVCRRNGVRCAAATLIPKAWLDYNRGDVHSVAPQGETFRQRRIRRFLQRTRPVVRYLSDRTLNKIRRRLDYSPLNDVFYRQFADCDLNLGLWSRSLRSPLPSDPDQGDICGFTWFDGAIESTSINEEVGNFLANGSPPIIFTLGTAVVSIAGHFYDMATEACRRLGRRGLLLIGSSKNIPRRQTQDVRAFDYVPLSRVLPHACLTVHHGGIGTTGQALRAGKPMLIIPFVYDQFDNAALAHRLRICLTLDRRRLNAHVLATGLKRLLDHPMAAERAAAIGQRIQAEDGALRAVTLLEGNSE